MKKVFLAGSRRFSSQLLAVMERLQEYNILVTKGRDELVSGTDEQEKQAHALMFERIENCDVVYVVAPDGYVGRTVALELGYAFAKGKEIVASHQLAEAGLMAVVSRVMSVGDFTQVLCSDYSQD